MPTTSTKPPTVEEARRALEIANAANARAHRNRAYANNPDPDETRRAAARARAALFRARADELDREAGAGS